MWQVLLGIYIFVIILSAIILWASLVLAKRSENSPESRSQPMADSTVCDGDDLLDNQIVELPSVSQHSEK